MHPSRNLFTYHSLGPQYVSTYVAIPATKIKYQKRKILIKEQFLSYKTRKENCSSMRTCLSGNICTSKLYQHILQHIRIDKKEGATECDLLPRQYTEAEQSLFYKSPSGKGQPPLFSCILAICFQLYLYKRLEAFALIENHVHTVINGIQLPKTKIISSWFWC